MFIQIPTSPLNLYLNPQKKTLQRKRKGSLLQFGLTHFSQTNQEKLALKFHFSPHKIGCFTLLEPVKLKIFLGQCSNPLMTFFPLIFHSKHQLLQIMVNKLISSRQFKTIHKILLLVLLNYLAKVLLIWMSSRN